MHLRRDLFAREKNCPKVKLMVKLGVPYPWDSQPSGSCTWSSYLERESDFHFRVTKMLSNLGNGQQIILVVCQPRGRMSMEGESMCAEKVLAGRKRHCEEL